MRKFYAVYFSPGTFVPEQTSKELKTWNPKEAVDLSKEITERYCAKPYGFQLVEVIASDPVPDGEGGTLEVQSKEVRRSGTYFLGGLLRTIDDVRGAADPKEEILLSNMECNDMPIVIQNDNSWRFTGEFSENDCIINANGEVTRHGAEPELTIYRREKVAERRRQLA